MYTCTHTQTRATKQMSASKTDSNNDNNNNHNNRKQWFPIIARCVIWFAFPLNHQLVCYAVCALTCFEQLESDGTTITLATAVAVWRLSHKRTNGLAHSHCVGCMVCSWRAFRIMK